MTIDLWMLLAIFVISCGTVVFVLEEIKYKHMRRGFIAEIERLRRDPGVRPEPEPEPVNEMKGVPVSETDGGKLYAKLSKGRCPDCGGEGFWEGPSGGISTNIFCVNKDCRSAFNITPMVGTADRIGKAPNRYYPEGFPEVREGDEKHQEVRASHKG